MLLREELKRWVLLEIDKFFPYQQQKLFSNFSPVGPE
jgi:hypothetical protein